MKKRSFVYLAIMLASILLLAACGTSSNEESNTNGSATEGTGQEAGQEKKPVLHVGTDAAFAPFEYMETGKIVGFDVDILSAVMKEAGFDHELQNLGWEPMLASLQNKSMDLGIAGITITPKRLETYDFSVPYFQATHMIVFKEGADIASAEDLKGLKVGVQTGTTGAIAAEEIMGVNNKNILKYETTPLTFVAPQNGNVDAVVTDNVVAAEYKKNNPDANVETITDPENFESTYYGIMFPKGSEYVDEISTALTTIIENGTYGDIYKKWFGEEPNTSALLEEAK